MTFKLNANRLVAVVLMALGLIMLLASFQINLDPDGGQGARIFPFLASTALLILGCLELKTALSKTVEGESSVFSSKRIKQMLLSPILWMSVLAFAYLWGIGRFGYLLSTAFVAPIALWTFGVRNYIGLLVGALLCPLIYHVLFFVVLDVFPPTGEWFDLLTMITGE